MRAVIALDADKDLRKPDGELLKPGVRRGEAKLIEGLLTVCEVYSAEWNIAGGKGIDDLLIGGGSYHLIDRYTKPTPRPGSRDHVPNRAASMEAMSWTMCGAGRPKPSSLATDQATETR